MEFPIINPFGALPLETFPTREIRGLCNDACVKTYVFLDTNPQKVPQWG
jgi:hypothetical protein